MIFNFQMPFNFLNFSSLPCKIRKALPEIATKKTQKKHIKRNQREHPAHNSLQSAFCVSFSNSNRLTLCIPTQEIQAKQLLRGARKLIARLRIERKTALIFTFLIYGPARINWRKRSHKRHFNNSNVWFCVTYTQQRNKQILCSLH